MRIIPLPGVNPTWPIPDVPGDQVITDYQYPHVDDTGYAKRLVEGKVIVQIGWAQLELSLEEAAHLGDMLCGLTPEEAHANPFTPGGGGSGEEQR